jgi:hypothetical protein
MSGRLEGIVWLSEIFKCGKLCFSSVYSLHHEFPAVQGPGVDSASNGNEYQAYFLGVNAAGA